ncbi:2OG-Fe(II) oxygenase [Legionella yabuuchiae]|uniref:2OG-Fe(II) oxygenase n=1 Tax=Legionella yabuuchiae TaxID=376727 RepID=UPI001F5F541C|nr:2OG-Fe(II) oxygenase [Legionella yabuuchiae]
MNTQSPHSLEDGIHQYGFHIIDNFLGKSDYQDILTAIATKYQAGHFRQARIGNNEKTQHKRAIRNDQICWLDSCSEYRGLKAYIAAIEIIRNLLNQTFFLSLVDFEAHFAAYAPGSFYRKHIDQFLNTQDRKISCVYYLNSDWQPEHGGELLIYNLQDELLATIQPVGNRMICFSSDLPHEVLPTKAIRYSITGWLKTRSAIPF